MNFKKQKEDILNEIYSNTQDTVRREFYAQRMRHYGSPRYGSMQDPYIEESNQSHLIAVAITEAMRTLVDNIYTDQDFEKDMGLDK